MGVRRERRRTVVEAGISARRHFWLGKKNVDERVLLKFVANLDCFCERL
jgi:hypothetical protein